MDGKFWGNVGLSTILVFLLAFTVSKISESPTGITGLLLPEITVSESAEELSDSVNLDHFSVTIPQTGHMVEASFSIDNKGADDIKNVVILCRLFDERGNEQGRNKWIVYDSIKSQKSENFSFVGKMFISKRTTVADCSIVDMQAVRASKSKVHHGSSVVHGNEEAGGSEHVVPVHETQH